MKMKKRKVQWNTASRLLLVIILPFVSGFVRMCALGFVKNSNLSWQFLPNDKILCVVLFDFLLFFIKSQYCIIMIWSSQSQLKYFGMFSLTVVSVLIIFGWTENKDHCCTHNLSLHYVCTLYTVTIALCITTGLNHTPLQMVQPDITNMADWA